jgi:hypothetical protein
MAQGFVQMVQILVHIMVQMRVQMVQILA